MPGEWVTERRSEPVGGRLGGEEVSSVHSESGVCTEMSLSLTWEGVCALLLGNCCLCPVLPSAAFLWT